MNELDLFTEALARTDPAERAAFLDQACAGNPDLRRRLDELLAGHARGTSPLDRPPLVPAGVAGAPAHPVPMVTGDYAPEAAGRILGSAPTGRERTTEIGTVIAGRYTLVEVIGEGGMGSVYLASQTEPVKRQVALKLIKTGMDSKAVLARFDAERQALALMDHPNIARIYDGGVTPSAQPFFVMELVKGVPITEYCDQKRLTVDARLQLFVSVCQAVQHAHQKGIIHRDLKPGNVLVTEVDSKPTPKVIDFGVAKATEQKLTDLSFADVGAIVGTPAYMSPEQADPTSMDIDTRTDVYALGVMLYELLTGSPPIDGKQFQRGAILEMLRMVREVEPPRPSTRLSAADDLPNVAVNRNTQPGTLAKLVKGELDWVVMKALEKDRNRRYETANGFAADVQRYLSGDAVLAHPPSTAYRIKKFIRRNRGQVIAASLVLFTLLAGGVGTTVGMIRAERSAIAEREAKREAQANFEYVRKGNKILGSVFANLDPRAKYETIAELRNALKTNLLDAANKLDDLGSDDPLALAELRHTLGASLQSLGEAELASSFFQQALDVRKAHLGTDHLDTLASASHLAGSYVQSGRAQEALPLLESTMKLRTEKLGPDHPDTLHSMNQLAGGNWMSAAQDLVVTPDRIGKGDVNQAHAKRVKLKFDLALSLWEKSLDVGKHKLAPDHPERLSCMYGLAFGYSMTPDKQHLVRPLLEDLLPLQKKRLGPGHPDTIATMDLLASYCDDGRKLALREEAFTATKTRFGMDHPNTLGVMHNLAEGYRSAGKHELALTLTEDRLKLLTVKYGPDDPTVQGTTLELADRYLEAKREPEASHLYRDYFDRIRKRSASAPTDVASELTIVSFNLLSHKVYPMAEQFLRECLAIREKHEPDDWTLFDTQALLGGALLGQKKYAEAEPLLVKGYLGMQSREKTLFEGRKKPILVPINEIQNRIPEALDRLIELYTATNKLAEVKKYHELRAKYPTPKEATPPPREKK